MTLSSLYLGFLFTLLGQWMMTAVWIEGDLPLGHRFAGGPQKLLKPLYLSSSFHPQGCSEGTQLAAHHPWLWEWGGGCTALSLSHPISHPARDFSKFQLLDWKHFYSAGIISGETLHLSCSFDWGCLGHLIPHSRWAFYNILGLNKLFFSKVKTGFQQSALLLMSLLFSEPEKKRGKWWVYEEKRPLSQCHHWKQVIHSFAKTWILSFPPCYCKGTEWTLPAWNFWFGKPMSSGWLLWICLSVCIV